MGWSIVPAPRENTKSCPRESAKGRGWKVVARGMDIGRQQANVGHERSKKQRRHGKNNLN